MKIGIIGAGNIGGTLARRLTAAGHDVSVAIPEWHVPNLPAGMPESRWRERATNAPPNGGRNK
jgi:3-hydroxyisobutyrate dehydrogenase-like beta-hydroxyacid dehydrogenase